jgi:uncharacterized protein YndB with AHSA1/START domain
MIMKAIASALILSAASAGAAQAEVTAQSPGGFAVRSTVEVAAAPDKVWDAVTRLHQWWDPSHSYSGRPGALSFEAKAGGCFCERWAGGEVQHGTVVMVMPRSTLRLVGALGPLQTEGATGAWTFELKPTAGGTTVTQTLTVGGWSPTGLDRLAAPVDGVLAGQLARLKRFAETGAPG